MLFVQLEKQQWHSNLKKVALLKNDFVISKKLFQNIFLVGKFRKQQMPLLQILCYIFYVFSELWGWENCQNPGKLVIEFLCSFKKLTGSDGHLYEVG